jgi:hypothetical protein
MPGLRKNQKATYFSDLPLSCFDAKNVVLHALNNTTMPTLSTWLRQPIQIRQTLLRLAAQVRHRMRLHLRSQAALAAEILFFKTQLALYPVPNPRWQCDINVTRFTRVWLSNGLDWQPALTVVQPETFKRWRRQGRHVDGASSARTPPIPPKGRMRTPQWVV